MEGKREVLLICSYSVRLAPFFPLSSHVCVLSRSFAISKEGVKGKLKKKRKKEKIVDSSVKKKQKRKTYSGTQFHVLVPCHKAQTVSSLLLPPVLLYVNYNRRRGKNVRLVVQLGMGQQRKFGSRVGAKSAFMFVAHWTNWSQWLNPICKSEFPHT